MPPTLDLAPLKTAAAEADQSAPDLTISPPSLAAKAEAKPKTAKTAAKASLGASKDGPIVLRQGTVALSLSTPALASDLSSGASVNLALPAGAVKAQANTSVGKDDGNWNAFWQKDSAKVEAELAGPMGTALSASGENQLSLNYRAPESVGAANSTTHVVRSENRSGRVDLAVPLSPVAVKLGAESTSAHSEDTSRDKAATTSAAVRTTDHTVFSTAAWSPTNGVALEGGVAARVANISWQDQAAHSASFQSLNPHLSLTLSPLRDTQLSAKVEHTVSPYDAGAFATYGRADGKAVVTGFEPDHAWQMEARVQQAVGPASVAASYTTASQGTVTEFAEVGGVQAPASTALLKRESVAVSVTMPLSVVGLPRTDLSSQARWQSSRVVDPVTQETRAASGETPHSVSVKLSHALPTRNLSFGLSGEYKGASTAYQVSELSTTAEGGSVGAFIAYKPGSYEIDVNVNGLYGSATRDDFYKGLRGSDSQISRSTVQDNSGPMLQLSLKKAL
ncbi:MAG: hypothetical protein P4L57_14795 [Rhizomicrobium sp.]|nr:hypothetical protein [Rhizomicrobium sp.]